MQTFTPRGKIHGPILPQFVLETSLSFGAKIMYALLCNYASEKTIAGHLRPRWPQGFRAV